MDRNDVIGAAGALLLGGGLWAQAGPAWAAMLWGALLLALYALIEMPRGGK